MDTSIPARVIDLAIRLEYLSTPDARVALPAPFGEYEFLEVLGQGGMGVVYRARQESLKRDVAIKILRESSDSPAIERLRREAQISAGLSHPNIAAVNEGGANEGTTYIAMQFIRGRTLSRIARTDPKTIVRLVRGAAVAVYHAHEHGFVHRDLKPDNLMVDGDRVFVMETSMARNPTSTSPSASGPRSSRSTTIARGSGARRATWPARWQTARGPSRLTRKTRTRWRCAPPSTGA